MLQEERNVFMSDTDYEMKSSLDSVKSQDVINANFDICLKPQPLRLAMHLFSEFRKPTLFMQPFVSSRFQPYTIFSYSQATRPFSSVSILSEFYPQIQDLSPTASPP